MREENGESRRVTKIILFLSGIVVITMIVWILVSWNDNNKNNKEKSYSKVNS